MKTFSLRMSFGISSHAQRLHYLVDLTFWRIHSPHYINEIHEPFDFGYIELSTCQEKLDKLGIVLF